MRVAMLGLSMLVLSGCGVVTKTVAESNTAKPQKLAIQSSDPSTPQEIYTWIQGNIHYEANEDEFRPAEQTLALGSGDCNDIAVLADTMLKKHGYASEILSVYTITEGHAVCVWKDSTGKYNHLSNKTIRQIQASSLAEVAQDVYADWTVCVTHPNNIAIKR